MLKKILGALMIVISFGSTKALIQTAVHAQQISGSDMLAKDGHAATSVGG
jgi:hypothetical protein